MYNPNTHHRKSIRLKEYDYTNANWYYVTICSLNKENVFSKVANNKVVLNDIGLIVQEEWLRTKEIRKNIDLDDYVIMPNHIHGIIIIEYDLNELNNNGDDCRDTMHRVPTDRTFGSPIPNSLSTIIGAFKAAATRRISKTLKSHQSIWQRNFYEHIIRNDDDLYRIRKYIQLNPLKWNLDEYNYNMYR